MGNVVISTALFLAVNIGGFFNCIIAPLGVDGIGLNHAISTTLDSIRDLLLSLSRPASSYLYSAFEPFANFSTDIWNLLNEMLFFGVNIPIVNVELTLYDVLTSVTVAFGVDASEMSLLGCAFLAGLLFLILVALFSFVIGAVKFIFEVIGILE